MDNMSVVTDITCAFYSSKKKNRKKIGKGKCADVLLEWAFSVVLCSKCQSNHGVPGQTGVWHWDKPETTKVCITHAL